MYAAGSSRAAAKIDGRLACAARLLGLAGAALLSAQGALAAQPAPPKRAAVDQVWVVQRASEAGAWWMLVQVACDAETATRLLTEMNAALVAMGNSDLQPLVAERIEDPHLDERSRAEMERVMQQAMAARRQADEMLEVKAGLGARKAAGALQRKDWQVARPIRTAADLDAAIKDTERALARFCAQGTAGAKAVLLDAENGLVRKLR